MIIVITDNFDEILALPRRGRVECYIGKGLFMESR